jgi:uncharacterized membrane protein
MLELLKLLGGTVVLRPYVFIFLAVYLVLAITRMGWRRTLLFTAVAYSLAFLCEFSSIHTGFPFGLYHYIPETRDRELWIAGVPFMDSLSFTFLSYISFELAILLRSPLKVSSRDVQLIKVDGIRSSWATTFLAGLMMMYLDIVIDPVALQGERWFLGKIYFYPYGGPYFGVPIANFLGWFFTCVVIIRVFLALENLITNMSGVRHYPFKGLGAAGLYFGVLGFNLTMTFLIGEVMMGWASSFIGLLLLLLLINHISYCRRFLATEHTEISEKVKISPL